MTLTREEVRDIALLAGAEAAEKVISRHEKSCPVVRQVVKEEIKIHAATCPVAAKLEITILRALLALAVSGAVGGGVVGAILKVIG